MVVAAAAAAARRAEGKHGELPHTHSQYALVWGDVVLGKQMARGPPRSESRFAGNKLIYNRSLPDVISFPAGRCAKIGS